MSLERSHVALAGFIVIISWGLAVRLAPFLWHLANAFILGSTLTALIILYVALTTSRASRTTSQGPQRLVPAFTTPEAWKRDRKQFTASRNAQDIQLHPQSMLVSQRISQLLNLAMRDFISSWYQAISPSSLFVDEVGKNIAFALAELRDRIWQQDCVDMIVSRVIPIITDHMREFDDAERSVRARTANRSLPESEEWDMAIAAKYKNGHLHPAVALNFSDTKAPQQDHLRRIMVRILPLLLEENMIRSRAVAVLIREIVACSVLLPLVQLLGDPDTWNQIVEAYGRTTLQDRKTVKKMRAALDEHTASTTKKQTPVEIPRLQPHDSERAFERFVRVIRKTKTLADARRFRSQLTSQIARERLVEGQDPVFLRRLEMGKRVLDQKIAKLTNSSYTVLSTVESDNSIPRVPAWTLVDIMRTASGLSYFMEFMDRQNRMAAVQFWVVVDGFRNPLEDDFGDEGSAATITWTDTDRLDIATITENYIMKDEIGVPKEFQDIVQEFLQAGRKATAEQYRSARMAILSSQSAVQEELDQKYLPKFRESDLYYKFLASDEGQTQSRHQSLSLNGASTVKAAPIRPKALTPTVSRSSSQVPIARAQDLRRAALSSNDIKSLGSNKASDRLAPVRRSLDVDRPLFDDEDDLDPLTQSMQSIGNDSIDGDFSAEPEMLEHMEAAFTDIMAQSPSGQTGDGAIDSLFDSHDADSSVLRPSLESVRTDSGLAQKGKPSLATLGLVSGAGRIGVFQDNDLFGDEAKFAEDEYADHANEMDKEKDEEIHQAAPGDLGLIEAITTLSDEIERLVSQESVVDTLTRKAELTNNVAELRILGKSKASLQREIRRKELQRQQYIVQESDNSLYGRASVMIESVMVGREDDGQEYAVYVIKVQRQAGDQMPAALWAVAHRYSEFHELHQKLRRRYPSTRNLDFPRRRMVMKLQKQFLHNRRIALEAYLQQLLNMPDVCRSRELRSFLSQHAISQPQKGDPSATNAQDMVTRIYNSVSDGMDEFLGNIAVLDQLSTAGQNLISAATNQIGTVTPVSPVNHNDVVIEPGSIAEAEAEMRAFEDRELAPFVKPICDIFLETFELNRGNNWLRGRAVVVVIHQLLGGTVERKVRDSWTSLFSPESLLRYVETAKNTMWPIEVDPQTGVEKSDDQRKMRPQGPARTMLQKETSRRDASAVLNTLVPELAGSVVGRSNAQAAAKRISAVMNNRRLNEHLIFTILDEVVGFLFDGLGPQKQAYRAGRSRKKL